MSDQTEFRYSIAIVRKVMTSRWNELPVRLTDDFRSRDNMGFERDWDMYAACFCTEADLPSQWCAYGDKGMGLAIGFRASALHHFGGQSGAFDVIPMQYDAEHLRKTVEQLCDTALQLDAPHQLTYKEAEQFWSEVMVALLNFAIRFKEPRFQREHEWRIVTPDVHEPPRISHSVSEQGRKFVKRNFIPELVSRIIVGPCVSEALERDLRILLDSNGFGDTSIQRSAITFRC